MLLGSHDIFAQTDSDSQSLKNWFYYKLGIPRAEEIENLKSGQESIKKELEIIKKLLKGGLRVRPGERRAQQPFKPVMVSIKGDAFKGDKNAKVSLLNFSDYQ